ncbi:MAG: potassium channel family protein [Candidatus Acidiferrales bacterium]
MRSFEAIAGVLLLLAVLLDAFEAIILPRRVTRRFRITRLFYRTTWKPWRAVGLRMHSAKAREAFFSFFGPLSLLLLLVVWAIGLIVGFALLLLAMGPPAAAFPGKFDFPAALYMSGTNFFTLGLDEVVPHTTPGRIMTVFEAGMGFGFLAIVIGYLPVIYQSFSRREVAVVLLDARAGSPPTAAELLRRHSHRQGMDALQQVFFEWERWSAELLESHLSYPVLTYYRSQHDNQSWLGALTAILDACALTIVGVEGACVKQAQLTFAMTRHAVVDLAQIFKAPPLAPRHDRLPPADLLRMREMLRQAGLKIRTGPAEDEKLTQLRNMYEPYVNALADFLAISVPPWIHPKSVTDNWRTSVWSRIADAPGDESSASDNHL